MDKALAFLQQIVECLEQGVPSLTQLQCLGPVPAPIEKRANRYRAQLLLSCAQRVVLHTALQRVRHAQQQLRGRGGIQWSIDVDPIEFS